MNLYKNVCVQINPIFSLFSFLIYNFFCDSGNRKTKYMSNSSAGKKSHHSIVSNINQQQEFNNIEYFENNFFFFTLNNNNCVFLKQRVSAARAYWFEL